MPSEPSYLAKPVAEAAALGLLEDPQVRRLLARLPDWLLRFQAPGGFAAFEREHGLTIPASLREFWAHPRLACAWTAAADGDVDALSEPPEVEEWDGGRYLTFDIHHHSGCAVGVRLDGTADPPVVLSFEPQTVWRPTLAGYLEGGFRAAATWRAAAAAARESAGSFASSRLAYVYVYWKQARPAPFEVAALHRIDPALRGKSLGEVSELLWDEDWWRVGPLASVAEVEAAEAQLGALGLSARRAPP